MFSQKKSGKKFVKLCWIPLQEHSCFWFEDRQLYQETALHTCLGLLVFSTHPISATMVDSVWTYIVSLTSYMATPCYFIDFVMLRIVLVTQGKKKIKKKLTNSHSFHEEKKCNTYISNHLKIVVLGLVKTTTIVCSTLEFNSAMPSSKINSVHSFSCLNKWRNGTTPSLLWVLCQTQTLVQTTSQFVSGNIFSMKTWSFCKWTRK